MSHRAQRIRIAALLLLASCSETPAEPALRVGGRDAAANAPSLDGGEPVGDAGAGRPDGGAILPGADEEIVLAYGAPEVIFPIEVAADLGQLDVVFSVDTTQSIQDAIDRLQDDLRVTIVTQLRARVPQVSFGVASFQDFPRAPFGSAGDPEKGPDTPYRLLTAITSSEVAVANAVARLDRPLGRGGDLPEAGAEALFQVATGVGYTADGNQLIEPYPGHALQGGGTLGGVGFRPNALHAVVHVTDAPTHTPEEYGSAFPGTHSLTQAAEALEGVGAHVLGIVSKNCKPSECGDPTGIYQRARRDLEQLALLTGAVMDGAGGCPTGIGGEEMPLQGSQCPLVFDVKSDGAGLSTLLVDAIVALVDELRFDAVSGAVDVDPLGFVRFVEALPLPGSGPDGAVSTEDRFPTGAPDGILDTYSDVRGGSTVRFGVHLRNLSIAPSDTEQRFRLTVQVTGDGLSLRDVTLRIVVPAGVARRDAGADAATDAGPGLDPDTDAGG